jgi:N-acetylglutamate synthase-like GNAT family acetyltransferase
MQGARYVGQKLSVTISVEDGIYGGSVDGIPYLLGSFDGEVVDYQLDVSKGKGVVLFTHFDSDLGMLIGHQVRQRPLSEISITMRHLEIDAKSSDSSTNFKHSASLLSDELSDYVPLRDAEAKTLARLSRKLKTVIDRSLKRIIQLQAEQKQLDALEATLEIRAGEEADIPEVEQLINTSLLKASKIKNVMFNSEFLKTNLEHTQVGTTDGQIVAALVYRGDEDPQSDPRTVVRLGIHGDYHYAKLGRAFLSRVISQTRATELRAHLDTSQIRPQYFRSMGFNPVLGSRGKVAKTGYGQSIYQFSSLDSPASPTALLHDSLRSEI